MSRFIIKRFLHVVPVLIGVSLIVFILMRVIPGDPATTLLGPNVTPLARKILSAQFALNDPLFVQYFVWFGRLLTGNAGQSIAYQQPVGPIIANAFINTAILSGAAAVLAVVGGFLLGLFSAINAGRKGGKASWLTAIVFVSAPQYVVALLFVVLFSVEWPIFPTGGIHAIGNTGIGDLLHHLVLPAIAACLVPLGIIARLFRSALSETFEQDFIEALRARGLSRRGVLKHAIYNTLPSLLTISGLQIGVLFGGVLFVETIFSWPGLGLLIYNAITQRDYPVLQVGILVWAVAIVLLNAFVDSAHAFLDPRVRA